jgi:hypothetical protein
MLAPMVMSSARLYGSPARVLCEDCGFLWYGATAVHGLSIIGHCPRCGGSLHFRDEPNGSSDVVAGAVDEMLDPAKVLGTPQSWDR